MKKRMKEKLENGEISQELYDELMSRWGVGTGKGGGKGEDETTEQKGNGPRSDGVFHISGSGHLADVVGKELTISGSGKLSGIVNVDYMRVTGSARSEGDIRVTGELEVSGSLRAEKSVSSGSLHTSGSLHAQSLKSGPVHASGSLDIKENAEIDALECSGGASFQNLVCTDVKSSGFIRAKSIKGTSIEIYGNVRSEEIVCEDFLNRVYSRFYPPRSEIGKLTCKTAKVESRGWFMKKGVIEIDEIVCKSAELEAVKSKKIVGDQVILGDDCEVDYVEARVIKVSGNAVVREKKIVGEGS